MKPQLVGLDSGVNNADLQKSRQIFKTAVESTYGHPCKQDSTCQDFGNKLFALACASRVLWAKCGSRFKLRGIYGNRSSFATTLQTN